MSTITASISAQTQHINLTQLLAQWQISGVTDLTDKIKIFHHEETILGGYSEVSKGSLNVDGHKTETVAVKKLNITNFKSRSDTEAIVRLCKRLAREVRVWKGLKHPNIIHFWGVYMSHPDRRPGMVMPWYQNGSASDYLRKRSLSASEKITLFYEIACGLEYLHASDPPIVHGDLKASNVLVNDAGKAILCDFGISRMFEEVLESTGATTSGAVAGALRWSAPEVVESDDPVTRFTPASDVWSFGCTGYEIFSGKLPYYEYRTSGPIAKRILDGLPPTWPGNVTRDGSITNSMQQSNSVGNERERIPSNIIQFIGLRWKRKPEERGRMNEILGEMNLLA